MFAQTIGGLDEVFLDVRDLPAMREFYTQVLGFEQEFYHEGEMLGLRTGRAALVLRTSERGSSGVSFVFNCDYIEQSLRAVTEKGVVVTQPVWEGHWGAKVASFEDPEGNTISLEQPTEATGHMH